MSKINLTIHHASMLREIRVFPQNIFGEIYMLIALIDTKPRYKKKARNGIAIAIPFDHMDDFINEVKAATEKTKRILEEIERRPHKERKLNDYK